MQNTKNEARRILFFTSIVFLSLISTSCFLFKEKSFNEKKLLTLPLDHPFFVEKPTEDGNVEKREYDDGNIKIEKDNFKYENFYSLYGNTVGLYNRKHKHIAFWKNGTLKTLQADWIGSVIGIITHQDILVAVTLNFGNTLGLVVLEKIEDKLRFKSIYPFYRTELKKTHIQRGLKNGRIRFYGKKVFNLKIDPYTLVRVSEERFGRWHRIQKEDLKNISNDIFYLDLTFSRSPQNAVLVYQENSFENRNEIVLAEYSLESKKILSKKAIAIRAGIYYSMNEKDQLITTRYENKTKSYVFDFYSSQTGELEKTQHLYVTQNTYPKNLSYNGNELHGFRILDNNIEISYWK